jgi:hypothetical protein
MRARIAEERTAFLTFNHCNVRSNRGWLEMDGSAKNLQKVAIREKYTQHVQLGTACLRICAI